MLQENLATSEISEKDNIELHTDQEDFELASSSKSEDLPSNSSIKSADSNANLRRAKKTITIQNSVGETVAHTSVELIFEGKVVNSLIEYLVKLKSEKKFVLLYIFFNDIETPGFLKWLCKCMGVEYTYFSARVYVFKNNNFTDSRGMI